MNIDSQAQDAAVKFMHGIRARLADLIGDRSTTVRLEIDGGGDILWQLYNRDAGKFSTGPNLSACIAQQVRLNRPAVRAQRKRREAYALLAEATALESSAA